LQTENLKHHLTSFEIEADSHKRQRCRRHDSHTAHSYPEYRRISTLWKKTLLTSMFKIVFRYCEGMLLGKHSKNSLLYEQFKQLLKINLFGCGDRCALRLFV